MGGSLSCIEEQVPSLQRLQYDMTPVKTKSLPVVWLLGPPGTGRHTQAKLLGEHLDFVNIQVGQLIEEEAKKDTDRSKLISEGLHHRNRKIPDSFIIDLIKEEMLRTADMAKGYIINNFPKTSKQASIFVREVQDVDVIIYLTSDLPVMIQRYKSKHEGRLDDEAVKKLISTYNKEAKEAVAKLNHKIEKIYTNDEIPDVFTKIEAAVNVRISTKTKITAESDYAQSQEQGTEPMAIL